jgi:hypothetical protein
MMPTMYSTVPINSTVIYWANRMFNSGRFHLQYHHASGIDCQVNNTGEKVNLTYPVAYPIIRVSDQSLLMIQVSPNYTFRS